MECEVLWMRVLHAVKELEKQTPVKGGTVQ